MNLASDELWFRDRVAIVTGAGGGMGRAIALALGAAGACVGVHYRGNRDGAEAVVAAIRENGGKAEAVQADLCSPVQVSAMFAHCDDAFDRPIEMLVNNAGDWMDKSPIVDCTFDQWEKMFSVNATSVFMCCQEAVKRMIASSNGGAIVNIGSQAGHTGGGGGTVPYAAAKAAVHTFTRGLAKEVASHKIRVNGVAPGMIDTQMLEGRVSEEANEMLKKLTPLGRFGEPEEIASAVLLLLSPGASYMTGQIIDINGGLLMR